MLASREPCFDTDQRRSLEKGRDAGYCNLWVMSVQGQSRPNRAIRATSAFAPLATTKRTSLDVSKVPIAFIRGIDLQIQNVIILTFSQSNCPRVGATRYVQFGLYAMLRNDAILALAAVMLLTGPASARPFYRLVEPTAACFLLGDARLLAQSAKDDLAGTSCLRLSPSNFLSNFLIDRFEEGFACLHYSRRDCLWAPSRAVRPTSVDDGVF